jgi:hypothetical protein
MKPGNRQYLLLKWCQFTQSLLLWEMGERIIFLMMPFCLCRKAFYFYYDRIFSLKKSKPILIKQYITISFTRVLGKLDKKQVIQ